MMILNDHAFVREPGGDPFQMRCTACRLSFDLLHVPHPPACQYPPQLGCCGGSMLHQGPYCELPKIETAKAKLEQHKTGYIKIDCFNPADVAAFKRYFTPAELKRIRFTWLTWPKHP